MKDHTDSLKKLCNEHSCSEKFVHSKGMAQTDNSTPRLSDADLAAFLALLSGDPQAAANFVPIQPSVPTGLNPPLLPVPEGLALPDDRLCDACQALNFSAERFIVQPSDHEEPGSETPQISLGRVQDMRNKPYCPFCRLVLVAIGGPDVPSSKDGDAVVISMSWSTDGPRPNPERSWDYIPRIRILDFLPEKENGEFLLSPQLSIFPQITLLANDAPIENKDLLVRPIKEDQIDFTLVKKWISMCEDWHGTACGHSEMLDREITNPADEIPSFRLIDVTNSCIVHAPKTHCKYVALSYVWGPPQKTNFLKSLKSNIGRLEQPGALLSPEFRDKIPQTISDAMDVVRELDLQYLWVDSLCIIQDDESGSKLNAIANMDLVYGACFMTIMAATGDNAHAGLPGVRPGTRGQRQPIEEIMPGLRLGYRPWYQHYMKDEVYFTRAWTYQEHRIAQRSLIFIGGQVVFLCGGQDSQWREDTVCEEESIRRTMGKTKPKVHRSSNDIGDFEGLILGYSELNLSYQSDIHNAFAGLANYFRRELKADLCHGIPDALFDWFLLWTMFNKIQIRGPVIRRPLAPSWSWAGWMGSASSGIWEWYGTRNIKKIRKAIRKRTWIIWYQRVAHDSTECVHVLKHSRTSDSSALERKNFYGSRIQDRFPFDCTRTLPTPRQLTHPDVPKYYKDSHKTVSGSGFLQFWTVSLVFHLDQPTSEVEVGWTENKEICVGVFGKDRRELGTIYVKQDWASTKVPGNHEFILLCEARDVMEVDDRPADGHEDDDDGTWKYRMMLLEWHSSGQWAERVSIGSIEKEDIVQGLDQGPTWKEIVLG